jgi:hypothetical protein
MTYIKYSDDPLTKRVSKAFANLCESFPTKKALRLIDKCFYVFNQSKVDASFCALENMMYPVDTQLSINFEVCSGDTLSLFDNALDTILLLPAPDPGIVTDANYPYGPETEYIEPAGIYGPSSVPAYYLLSKDKNYARGILLWVSYPSADKSGNDVIPAHKVCDLTIWKRDGTSQTLSLNEFFSHFANPQTLAADRLINKIEITNPVKAYPTNTPDTNFSITVTGLIIYTKNNTNPADCAC